MSNKKKTVIIYPHFSMQEIRCLTEDLTVVFGETLDVYAGDR